MSDNDNLDPYQNSPDRDSNAHHERPSSDDYYYDSPADFYPDSYTDQGGESRASADAEKVWRKRRSGGGGGFRRFSRVTILLLTAASVVAFIVFLLFQPSGLKMLIPLGTDHSLSQRPRVGGPGEKVLLLMGVDAADPKHPEADSFDGARTDVMIMARVSPKSKTLSLVSIPRDSKVYFANNRGTDKINAAHAYGGTDLAVATVEESFGIPVDNFILINYAGVREVVDVLGGVDVYVEKKLRYRDRSGGLDIDFDKGWHHLDGKKAEEYLRFRHDEYGDIGRVRRQQTFLLALSKKLKDPWVLPRLPGLIRTVSKYVKTDLSFDDMIRLASFAPNLSSENIRSATLPGAPSRGQVSYWVVNPSQAEAVLDRMILGISDAVEDVTKKKSTSLKWGNNKAPEPKEVLNVGILYTDTASEELEALATKLEESGHFKVLCKTQRRRGSTSIVEHTNKTSPEWTKRITALDHRLKNKPVNFAPIGTTYEVNACSGREDYTVILGSDFAPAEN